MDLSAQIELAPTMGGKKRTAQASSINQSINQLKLGQKKKRCWAPKGSVWLSQLKPAAASGDRLDVPSAGPSGERAALGHGSFVTLHALL